MVEFALVSVVAFALIFGMAGLGLVVFGNSIGSNAARDGARVALINYVDADIPGSTNNLAVVSAVKRRLAGLDTFQSATVVCRPADNLTATEPCESSSVDLDRSDVVEVAVTWRAGGVPPFGGSTHSATARMVIGGAPDLSTPPTSPTTTTTTGASTTTTTAPATTQTEIAAQMADNDHDGRIDQVLVTFSGALNSTCTAGWTLANVPSGGSLAGVTVSGSTATLNITEGPGAQDTSVGAFTVKFAGCSNAAAFGPLAPSDAAGPVFVSMSDTPGTTDGKPEPGDTLSLLFSEPLIPTWGSSTTVSVTIDRQGSHTATISIPSLVSGNLFDSGSTGYVGNNKTATFSNSTLSVSGATLTLTLGSACTGCTDTGVGQGSFTFVPDGSIRDAAGYISIAPISATNLKLF
jgi:hypothetical protein